MQSQCHEVCNWWFWWWKGCHYWCKRRATIAFPGKEAQGAMKMRSRQLQRFIQWWETSVPTTCSNSSTPCQLVWLQSLTNTWRVAHAMMFCCLAQIYDIRSEKLSWAAMEKILGCKINRNCGFARIKPYRKIVHYPYQLVSRISEPSTVSTFKKLSFLPTDLFWSQKKSSQCSTACLCWKIMVQIRWLVSKIPTLFVALAYFHGDSNSSSQFFWVFQLRDKFP